MYYHGPGNKGFELDLLRSNTLTLCPLSKHRLSRRFPKLAIDQALQTPL